MKFRHLLFANFLLTVTTTASADPFTIIAGLSAIASAAVAGGANWLVLSATQWMMVSFAATAFGALDARRRAKKVAATQRAEYNSKLEDRTITVLTSDPPWRVIYGEAVVGGVITDIFTTDDSQAVREDGSTYAKADGLRHMVIVLAAHECQSIEDVYLDGVSIGSLDGNGWASGVTAASSGVVKTQLETRQVSFMNSTVLSEVPVEITYAVDASTMGQGVEAGNTPTAVSVTWTLGTMTLSGPPGVQCIVEYTVQTTTSSLRIGKHLGSSTQTVDAYLNAVNPTRYTANHRLRGLCYVSVTMRLTDQRFQGGPPALTFRVRGRNQIYDPRTSTTSWSNNPALVARDFLMAPWGAEVLSSEINTAFVNAAANACDVRVSASVHNHSGTFTVDAATDVLTFTSEVWVTTGDGVRLTTTGALPTATGGGLSVGTTYYVIAVSDRKKFKLARTRDGAVSGTAIDLTNVGTGTHTATWYDYATYTCDGAFTTDDGPEGVLDEILNSMAGQAAYGGEWQISAGVWTAPVMTLGDDDLSGQVEIVQADADMDDLFNGVRGQYIPASSGTPVDYEPYKNSTYVTADGKELWINRDLPWTNNKARARNLTRIHLEKSRSAQVIRFPAKMRAWPLQVGDRVTVSNSLYNIVNKTYRVTDWHFGLTAPVTLLLEEDDPTIWDLADATVADQTPNTSAVNPWKVDGVTGLTAASGDTYAVRAADGTVSARVYVTWSEMTDSDVRDGGAIEVRWRYGAGDLTWNSQTVAPDAVSAYISGVTEGYMVIIQAQARNKYGVFGPPSFVTHVVTGKTAAPTNVTSLNAAIKPGQVAVTWTACPDPDYASTELRYGGADWASATLLWRGAGKEYQWPRPADGAYTIRAAHLNTSGLYSATPATTSVTVDNTIDPGAGTSAIEVVLSKPAVTLSADSSGVVTSYVGSGGTLRVFEGVSELDFTLGAVGNGQWTATRSVTGGTVTAGGISENVLQASVADHSSMTTDYATVTYSVSGKNSIGVAFGPITRDQTISKSRAGAAGTSTLVLEVYKSGDSVAPTSTTATYTFSTDTFSAGNLTSGWTRSMPAPSGTTPIYRSTWTVTTTTPATPVTISGTWSTPTIVAQNGAAGSTGNTSFLVVLYQRTATNSAPSVTTTGNSSYNLTTGVISGQPASWSVADPGAGSGAYLWAIQQAGNSSVNPATLANTGWSSPILVGVDTTQRGIARMWQWGASGATPGKPVGSSTWTWATSTISGYVGGGGWSMTIPSNPGTVGWVLYEASKAVSDGPTATATTVTWANDANTTVSTLSANGTQGSPGTQSASPTVYRWDTSTPAAPVGSPTYTWSTGLFGAAPTNWTLTPGTAPSPGYTLYGATVSLIDTTGATATGFNWSSASITARGYAGTNGTGAQGASARYGYARIAGNPSATGTTCTVSGDVRPNSTQSSTAWGASFAVTWSATDPDASSNNTLYQIDGIYDPATTNTVWSTPYISSLKVGSLSAVSVNTGSLTVNGTINVNGGLIKSNNYVAATSGWQIKDDGSAEFAASSIRGQLTASQINTNGLAIRDGSGNVIFGASPTVDPFSYFLSPPQLTNNFNFDFQAQNVLGWTNMGAAVFSDTTASGGYHGRVQTANAVAHSQRVPVDPVRVYQVRVRLRRSIADGTLSVGVMCFDAASAEITGSGGMTRVTCCANGETLATTGTWVTYEGVVTGSQLTTDTNRYQFFTGTAYASAYVLTTAATGNVDVDFAEILDVTNEWATAPQLTVEGGAMSVGPGYAIKSRDTAVDDSGVRTTYGYAAGAAVEFRPLTTNKRFVIGLNSDPTTDATEDSIDYGLRCHTDGTLWYHENSGTGVALGVSYALGDVLQVRYDGTNVTYVQNGTVRRTVPVTITGALYLDSSFTTRGGAAGGIQFGPLSRIPANVGALTGTESINNSLISLSGSNGTISINGAGGGSVTGIVMPGNQITSANASTYLASAAIGGAYIGTLTASNLTVTTLSNVVNNSASSGNRVEIGTNVIRVYDASNVLRVKIGNLV